MHTHPTQKIVKLAYAAYRINNGYEKNTRRHSEDKPTVWSNKELIRYTLAAENAKDDTYLPQDFDPIKVLDIDEEEMKEAEKHLRRYTLQILGDDLNDFQKDVFAAYSQDELPINKLGLIAYLPAMVKREIEDISYKKFLKQNYNESKAYTGNRVQAEVEILKIVPMPMYDTTLYIAGSEGNLVSFTTKKPLKKDQTYNISARVKGEGKERDTGFTLTRLNYVKVLNG